MNENKNMHVLILAGGMGTRLKPITEKIPKPMVPINGVPFLQYQIELIKSFGLKKILLLVGYLGEQIEEYFGDGKKFGVEIDYSYEETPLGTGGALKNAEMKIEEEFLLLNGDTYLPIDYHKFIDCFHSTDCLGMIAVYDNGEKIVPNNISIDRDNYVTAYNKYDSSGMTYVDAGAILFKKEVLNFIPEKKVCSLEEEIFCKLIRIQKLAAFQTSKRFYDMGTFNELEVIRGVLK